MKDTYTNHCVTNTLVNNFFPGASSLSGSSESGDGPQKVTLVYFIGGCTYAEVAALRFLSVQDNGKKA